MNNKIQNAFAKIKASEKLKQETLKYISSYEPEVKKEKRFYSKFSFATVCSLVVVCLITSGFFSYTTAVASISMDINPSVELDINVFNRVIKAKGYNEEGEKLTNEVRVINKDYLVAIDNLMNSKTIENFYENGNNMEITVTSSSDKRNEKIKSLIQSRTDIEEKNIFCSCNHKERDAAHSHGMSHGKYRAYIKLKETNPDITIEEVKEMPMDKIKELTNCQSETGKCQNHKHNHSQHSHHKNR